MTAMTGVRAANAGAAAAAIQARATPNKRIARIDFGIQRSPLLFLLFGYFDVGTGTP